MAAAQDLYLQLKRSLYSEFCERCCVCGRSLIGIYDLATQQIYWCPAEISMCMQQIECGPTMLKHEKTDGRSRRPPRPAVLSPSAALAIAHSTARPRGNAPSSGFQLECSDAPPEPAVVVARPVL